MFISSENSAAVITSNSERKILVLAGSFFDKIHCMYWTTRFTFSWKVHFKKVFVSFDMFEDTSVTRGEWRKMMQLNIPETVLPEFVSDAKETISAIDRWVTEEIGENEEFIVIGV